MLAVTGPPIDGTPSTPGQIGDAPTDDEEESSQFDSDATVGSCIRRILSFLQHEAPSLILFQCAVWYLMFREGYQSL